MKLLIVEPKATGHHMMLYVRFIVRAAIHRGWTIYLLTTKQAVNHPSFNTVLKEGVELEKVFLMDEIKTIDSVTPIALFLKQNQYFESISKGFYEFQKSHAVDIVYMSNLDYFDKVLALRGSPFGKVPFVGLMMKIAFHRKEMGIGPPSRSDWIYENLFKRCLNLPQLRRVVVIDECFFSYSQTSSFKNYKKIVFSPDVGEISLACSRSFSRDLLSFSSDEFVILVYGSLTRRKGIKELVEAVFSLGNPKITILLAGKQNKEIQQFLAGPVVREMVERGNLIELDYFHTEEQENQVFSASDAVWVGYVDFYGSSGVLLQAASLSMPVLATSNGLIGWLVKKHNIGLSFEPQKNVEVKDAIHKIWGNPLLGKQFGSQGYDLSKQHSSKLFADSICSEIESLASEEKRL